MIRRALARVVAVVACAVAMPAVAIGQPAAAAAPPAPPESLPMSRLWIVGGGGSTSLLGDCTDCEERPYTHGGSVTGIVGRSINRRTDVGAEVLWMPTTMPSGDDVRITFLMASVQFRPWRTKGFFVRGGMGMAFVRNWLATVENTAPPIRSRAFGLGLGTGWEWLTGRHGGAQIYAAQHVAALGDLTTSTGSVENVMGNFWSIGGAFVIR